MTVALAWRGRTRYLLSLASALPAAGVARLLSGTVHATRFSGAYRSRDEALNAVDRIGAGGYDDETIAEVSFDVMCRRVVWDYPILLWLERLLPHAGSVLDAGGHLGTKYIAWSDLLDMSGTEWTVLDLPGIIRAAKARQAVGGLPAAIGFEDWPERAPAADILICSGLLQYIDTPFPQFVDSLRRPPPIILINKVALWDGEELHTIERIGKGRVPYRIRNRVEWTAEIDAMGYDVLDTWEIPELSHVIPSHPWLGQSESCGYVMRQRVR